MNYTGTIHKIKVLLGLPVNFENMKLDDGVTILQADKFEAGQAVMIVNETEMIPLPVGEYNLEDGRILIVTEEGMINEIKEAQVTEDVQTEETSIEASTEEIKAAEDDVIEETPAEVEYVTKEDFDKFVSDIMAVMEEIKSAIGLSKETMLAKDAEIERLKAEVDNKPAATKIKQVINEDLSRPLTKMEKIYQMIQK